MIRGYQAFTIGDYLGSKENLSFTLYGKPFDNLPTFQKDYIQKQIEKKQLYGYYSEWLTEKLILATVVS